MLRARALGGTVVVLAALLLIERVLRPPAPPRVTTAAAPMVVSPVQRATLPARSGPGAAEVRAEILAAGDAVYLPAMFAETDSVLRRWDDSTARELRIVFVRDTVPGWTPELQEIARRSLAEWEGFGIGVRFVEVVDTAGAHIVVRWIPRFTFDRTGQADIEWDGAGRIRRAEIQLALADQRGRPLSAEGMRAVALHEVGHALGLPHSDREDDLMFPTTRRPELTSRDVATIRLLYRLPTGPIK